MKPWPRLSQDLPHKRHPEVCQACGVHNDASPHDLQRWREHDQDDRPEHILVILCTACAEQIIEPHPRLYARVDDWEPVPGAMDLCLDCRHRDGLACLHPCLKRNGGPGLQIVFPQPLQGHWSGRGAGGRRTGGMFIKYRGRPTACEGQDITKAAEAARSDQT